MRKAVIYGAGSIGRGFIGHILYLSGYEIVFLDIDEALIDKINEDRSYSLRLVSTNESTEIIIENVRGVLSSNSKTASEEIAAADILFTAVGANHLSKIAPVIANGLSIRWQAANYLPLNIIICENLIDANKVMEELLLKSITDNLYSTFYETVGLVEASIERMVPIATEAMQQGSPTRVWAEPYIDMPVDKDGFKGEIPEIIGFKAFSPFSFFIERKLYMHNMSHAALAYLGYLAGCEFIWEAVRDNRIAYTTAQALQESAEALSKKHRIPKRELYAFAENLMQRFDNPQLGDTVFRVGRDPIRKLSYHDRLVGAATICLEQGIQPNYIAKGIAAGLFFAPDGDENAHKIQNAISTDGLEAVLQYYCGINSNNPLRSLILKNYEKIKLNDYN